MQNPTFARLTDGAIIDRLQSDGNLSHLKKQLVTAFAAAIGSRHEHGLCPETLSASLVELYGLLCNVEENYPRNRKGGVL